MQASPLHSQADSHRPVRSHLPSDNSTPVRCPSGGARWLRSSASISSCDCSPVHAGGVSSVVPCICTAPAAVPDASSLVRTHNAGRHQSRRENFLIRACFLSQDLRFIETRGG